MPRVAYSHLAGERARRIGPDVRQTCNLGLDLCHSGEDVMAVFEIWAEHLFVVEKSVTSFSGKKEGGHSPKCEIEMPSPLEILHHNEELAIGLRFHKWCRYWDGSERKQLVLRGRSGSELVCLAKTRQEGTSERQTAEVWYPQLYKRHPCLHRQFSRGCGSGRAFDR
jgi:hypothetical protein